MFKLVFLSHVNVSLHSVSRTDWQNRSVLSYSLRPCSAGTGYPVESTWWQHHRKCLRGLHSKGQSCTQHSFAHFDYSITLSGDITFIEVSCASPIANDRWVVVFCRCGRSQTRAWRVQWLRPSWHSRATAKEWASWPGIQQLSTSFWLQVTSVTTLDPSDSVLGSQLK